MRNKKLLSTVVATALIASTMVMPVMAEDGTPATPSGSFDIDVTTKTGVIRVEVPTNMTMAVDQFEITHPGTQIAAGEFDMTNKSEMDVKVEVTSEAILKSGNSLVSTAKAAEDSTTDGEAWLGVATKTNDGTANSGKEYDDPQTGTDAEANVEDFWELTDENSNVTSFASDTKKAVQTFYLAKGTGSAEYKLALPSVTGYKEKTYAKYYQLTPLATQPGDNDELQAAVDSNDVYVVVTGDIGKNETIATKIEKGTQIAANTWANSNTYCTVSEDAATPGDNTDTKTYVYAAMTGAAASGGKAGFTYIGKLSPKQETWTKDDITKVKVSYNIGGVTASRYEEVADDCTYGLYQEASYISTKTLTVSSYSLTLSLPAGVTISKVELTNADGTGAITLTNGTQYAQNGTAFAIPANNISTWLNASPAKNKVKLTYSNGKSEIITLQR